MSHPDTFIGLHRAARFRVVTLIVAALCLTAASSAGAAKVYRCGNTFQDQPCTEAKPAETRPAEKTAVTRQVVPDCEANAKDAGGRTDRSECGAMKVARDSTRSSPAIVKP